MPHGFCGKMFLVDAMALYINGHLYAPMNRITPSGIPTNVPFPVCEIGGGCEDYPAE